MPPRSTVYTLDEEIRGELDRRIIGAGFGRYEEHAAWLAERGSPLGVSALKRYGKNLRRTAAREAADMSARATAAVDLVRRSTELARAINAAAGDDPLAVPERTAQLLMVRLYDLATGEGIDGKTLQTITRSLNDSLKTLAAIRSEKEALREAARFVAEEGRRMGLSEEGARRLREIYEGPSEDTIKRIRRDVYGIHDAAAAENGGNGR